MPAQNTVDADLVRPWLVRIPAIFEGLATELLSRLGAVSSTRLGADYYLIKSATVAAIHQAEEAKFLSWNLPMEHTWPCHPKSMEGFVEKAAQTLWRKFGERQPQGIFMGPLHPSSPDTYFKSLASNLRGRTLQLFPDLVAGNVEDQDPLAESLFCLVGKEGLFCGMQAPQKCNGLYPGGSKFIDKGSPNTISRAGAKIAEALHYLLMYRPPFPEGSHWLELGASPGGMTSELLARGQRVTAIDRAPLDKRLNHRAGLTFLLGDAATFNPPAGIVYDALLSDLNGPAEESIEYIIRLLPHLNRRGLVIFTLKLPKVETIEPPCTLCCRIVRIAGNSGLQLLAQTHLTYNRHEFTLFFERTE